FDPKPEQEVRRVKEEKPEEEDELPLAPEPPVSPAELRPERAGEQRHRAEDDAEVEGVVPRQTPPGLALPQMDEPLPGAPPETRVGGQRDRDVEVEDLLVEAVLVDRGVEKEG